MYSVIIKSGEGVSEIHNRIRDSKTAEKLSINVQRVIRHLAELESFKPGIYSGLCVDVVKDYVGKD